MSSAKKFIKRLRLPAKASLSYVAVGIVTKAAGFLITPYFTRAMSENEYGSFTLYISILGVVTILTSAFTSGSTVYVGFRKYKEDIESYYPSILLSIMAVLSAICLLLFTLTAVLQINVVSCTLIFLQALFDSVVNIYLSTLRFSYSYKAVSVICIFEAFTAPPIAVALINFGVGGDIARILSLLFVSFIAAAYSFSKLLKNGAKPNKDMVKYTFSKTLPHIPYTLSSAINAGVDKFVITAALGASALAKYSVVHSVSAGLTYVASAVSSALTPWIIRHSEMGDDVRVSLVLKDIFRIFCMLTLFLVAIMPEALLLLAPREYSDALGAALPISLSSLPTFLISVCYLGITHSEQSKYSLTIALGCAAFNILFAFLLIPTLGFLGAGGTLLLSQTIGAALSVYYLKKCKINYFPDKKGLIFTSLLTIGLGILLTLCYDLPALRVLILIIPSISLLDSLFSANRYVLEA